MRYAIKLINTHGDAIYYAGSYKVRSQFGLRQIGWTTLKFAVVSFGTRAAAERRLAALAAQYPNATIIAFKA